MKKITFILLLSFSTPTCIRTTPQPVDITNLLEDARADGVADEIIELPQVGIAELWLRKVGGALITGYMGAKYYTLLCWQQLTGEQCLDDSDDAPQS